jgi:hypothetical protein
VIQRHCLQGIHTALGVSLAENLPAKRYSWLPAGIMQTPVSPFSRIKLSKTLFFGDADTKMRYCITLFQPPFTLRHSFLISSRINTLRRYHQRV